MFSQGEDDGSKEEVKHEVHAWYEKRVEEDSKSSGSKGKDDKLSTKEMLDCNAKSRKDDGNCVAGSHKPFKG